MDMMTNEHFRYEHQMLGACFQMLGNLSPITPEKQAWFNAVHESFCVHANNLMETLAPPSDRYLKEEFHKYRSMIWDQILTLSERRTAEVGEKITFPNVHARIIAVVNEQLRAKGIEEIVV
jgi:hypothetical protein